MKRICGHKTKAILLKILIIIGTKCSLIVVLGHQTEGPRGGTLAGSTDWQNATRAK